MKRLLAVVVLTAWFGATEATAQQDEKKAGGVVAQEAVELEDVSPPANVVGGSRRVTVAEVTGVKVAILKSNPPQLKVEATGEVPTGGYKDARLNRVVYVTVPADGIQDYYFTAQTPADGTLVPQMVSKVTASDTWPKYPDWVKGVRVHGADGGVKTYKFKKK